MALNIDNTAAGTVNLKAASSGNVTFVLPATNGTDGQVLTTDGNGITSWTDVGSDLYVLKAGDTMTGNLVVGDFFANIDGTFGNTVTRSFRSTATGLTYLKGDSGSWAVGYKFEDYLGVDLGGFGAYGTGDTLEFWGIGQSYADNVFQVTPDGTINFPKNGQRITGNFSAADVLARTCFQTNQSNLGTVITAIPNGSGVSSSFQGTTGLTANESVVALSVSPTAATLVSSRTGSGSFIPLKFYTGGAERISISDTGIITLLGQLEILTYTETVEEPTIDVTTTVDCATGTIFDFTLDQNTTIAFSNVPATVGKAISITLLLRQNGTGNFSVSWPGSVVWSGGIAPTITATPNKMDIISLLTVDNGTTWYGNYSQNF